MIRIHGLRFSYDGKTDALRRIDLDVADGEIALLVGPNGSGKSTLLHVMAGIYAPTAGETTISGLNSPGREREIRRVSRLVMQDADLQIIGSTLAEDLTLEPDIDIETARVLAESLGLAALMERPVHTLSWGQKRKLCLATALLARPRLLLLDEPFSGLDYQGATEMRRIIRCNARAGMTQIVSTHDLEPLADIADRIIVMREGETALAGRPDEVLGRLRGLGVRPPCSWSREGRIEPWDEWMPDCRE